MSLSAVELDWPEHTGWGAADETLHKDAASYTQDISKDGKKSMTQAKKQLNKIQDGMKAPKGRSTVNPMTSSGCKPI